MSKHTHKRHHFDLRQERDDKVTVIEAPEHLDFDAAKPIRSILAELVEQGKYQVVINLSETQHIDSSGLAALLSRIAVMRSHGGDLRFAGASENILKILELTNLDRIVKVYDNVAAATASFE